MFALSAFLVNFLYIVSNLPDESFYVSANVTKPRMNNEKLLIQKFMDKYPVKYGRPLKNISEGPITIGLRVQLIQIVKVDPLDQVLVTNVWNNFHWIDPYLAWEPDKYNGLSVIRIPPKLAFEHDITLLNTADERLENKREALLVVYSNGEILWIPRSLFYSTCAIDLNIFPFDTQNCSLSFGSWAYDNTLIDMEFYEDVREIDLNDYEPSKEWTIDRNELRSIKTYRQFEDKNYTVLTYYLVVTRNPRFYIYLLIYPCILLAILTMVVFWLPPENPSKIILGMNIFTAFFLLLLLLAEIVPTSTNVVPYIGKFFCMSMIMIAVSSFLCTIVVHFYFRAETFCKMPYIIKKIFLDGLARLYLMQPPKQNQSVTQRTLLHSGLLQGNKSVQNADKFEKFELLKERFKSYRENVLKIGFENLLRAHPAMIGSCQNVNNQQHPPGNLYSSASSSPASGRAFNNNCQCSYCTYCARQHTILAEIAYLNNLENDIKEIRDYLRDTRKKLENKEIKLKVASDWKQVALVLDRTFFIIYFIITFSTLIFIFTRDPILRPFRSKVSSDEVTTAATTTAAATTLASDVLATISNAVANATAAIISSSNSK